MLRNRRATRVIPLVFLLSTQLAGCTLINAIRPRVKSPEEREGGVVFRYDAPSAIRMNLAGDFNQWCDTANGRPIDVTMDPMEMDEDGIWWIVLPLEPGTYQYKYIIDGGIWQHDTNNLNTTPDGFGGLNSVVVVKGYGKAKGKPQRLAECEALEREIEAHQEDLARLTQDIERERGEAPHLRERIRGLDRKIRDLENRIASLEAREEPGVVEPHAGKKVEGPKPPPPGRLAEHVVIKGECLWMIAGYEEVYGDPHQWPRLYEANRDRISDPNLIYPDQILTIPR